MSQLANWKVIRVIEQSDNPNTTGWVYEYKNSWTSLEEEHSNLLETLFTLKVTDARYILNSSPYEVDFAAMTLKNCTTTEQYLLMKFPDKKS